MGWPTRIVLGLGLAFLLAAALVAASIADFSLRAKSATAVCVDSVGRHSTKYGQILHARFVFTPAPGQPPQTIVSSIGSSDGFYARGDTVRVYFEAAHPEQARIATFLEMWLGPTVLAVPGLVLVLIGILLRAAAIRRQR